MVLNIELTTSCNHSCEFCYFFAQRTARDKIDLSASIIIETIKKLKPQFITLGGGNPLLYPELDGLISSIKQDLIDIPIGITINHRDARRFLYLIKKGKLQGLDGVAISIPADEVSYISDEIIDTINNIAEVMTTRINFVMNKTTFDDNEIHKLKRLKDVDFVFLPLHHNKRQIAVRDLIPIAELGRKLGLAVIGLPACYFGCGAGQRHMTLGVDGQLKPCSYAVDAELPECAETAVDLGIERLETNVKTQHSNDTDFVVFSEFYNAVMKGYTYEEGLMMGTQESKDIIVYEKIDDVSITLSPQINTESMMNPYIYLDNLLYFLKNSKYAAAYFDVIQRHYDDFVALSRFNLRSYDDKLIYLFRSKDLKPEEIRQLARSGLTIDFKLDDEYIITIDPELGSHHSPIVFSPGVFNRFTPVGVGTFILDSDYEGSSQLYEVRLSLLSDHDIEWSEIEKFLCSGQDCLFIEKIGTGSVVIYPFHTDLMSHALKEDKYLSASVLSFDDQTFAVSLQLDYKIKNIQSTSVYEHLSKLLPPKEALDLALITELMRGRFVFKIEENLEKFMDEKLNTSDYDSPYIVLTAYTVLYVTDAALLRLTKDIYFEQPLVIMVDAVKTKSPYGILIGSYPP